MKWLFAVATVLIVATAYVYIKHEKFQVISSLFQSVRKSDSSNKEVIYRIEHLNDATSVETIAGTLSLKKHDDSTYGPIYILGGKRLLESSFDYIFLNEKIDSGLETLIVADGSSGNAVEGSEIISIAKDGSYHDLSNSFGDKSFTTPKVSTDGKKVIFEFETSEKYMTGQEIWSYEHGTLSGPTKNIKPKYDFDVNTLLKLKSGVSQKIDGKIISDEYWALVLKTKNHVIEPCNEEVFDTFTFEADVAPPKKDSEGVFDAVIECNGSRAENFGPKITAISLPFVGSYAIKNIRLGMTLDELGPFIASKSIYCPEVKAGVAGMPDLRLCAIGSGGYGPPKEHLELADTVAGLSVNEISLLFYKNTLYAASIKLDWGNDRQIKELAAALVGKFGSPAGALANIKGMDVAPTFQSWTNEQGHLAYNSIMWKNSNGQLLFLGAAGVFPIPVYQIGEKNIEYIERNKSYKSFMNSNYDPNRPPQDVIITMVVRATVEMIANQAEKDEQESDEKSRQESMQKQMDELTKIRKQAKQDALSL